MLNEKLFKLKYSYFGDADTIAESLKSGLTDFKIQGKLVCFFAVSVKKMNRFFNKAVNCDKVHISYSSYSDQFKKSEA